MNQDFLLLSNHLYWICFYNTLDRFDLKSQRDQICFKIVNYQDFFEYCYATQEKSELINCVLIDKKYCILLLQRKFSTEYPLWLLMNKQTPPGMLRWWYLNGYIYIFLFHCQIHFKSLLIDIYEFWNCTDITRFPLLH